MGFIVFAAGMLIVIAGRSPGPDAVDLVLREKCAEKYRDAQSLADTMRADNFVPEPGLQGKYMQRCSFFRPFLRQREGIEKSVLPQSPPPLSAMADRCQRTVNPSISSDSVGPLAINETVRRLRAMCPSGRDTVRLGQETASPAVVFNMGAVRVIASQGNDSLVDSEPADRWVVSGSGGRLPLSLSLASTWKDLHARYGDAWTDENTPYVMVTFCRLPRLTFELDYEVRPENDSGPTSNLSFIPPSTTIQSVWVLPEPHFSRPEFCKSESGH